MNSFAKFLLAGIAVTLLIAVPVRAQDDEGKDADGCKDSALITRLPGSIINSCDNEEYEQADFPMPKDQTKHRR